MIWSSWVKLVGDRVAKPLLFAILALVLVIGFLTLSRCDRDDTAQEQAKQTTRSGEAVADAAKDAIATVEDRTVTDATIDQAVEAATRDIDNAKDVDAVRAVVVGRVCQSPAHRNDPACTVR